MNIRLITGIFSILFFANFCEGQNLTTSQGLKYGSWIDTLENIGSYSKIIDTGAYEIISINTYPIIRTANSGSFIEVKYQNGSAYIFFSKKVNDSIPVSNGNWSRFDSLGHLISTINWNKGIMLSAREYDIHNNLIEFDTSDFKMNCYTVYRYANKRLFSIKYTSPKIKNPIYTYYPNDNLSLSNAEPTFISDFLKKPIDTFKLTLSSKEDLKIMNIKDSTRNFIYLDKKFKPISFPYSISKKVNSPIYILFKPSPESLKKEELITIITNDPLAQKYNITAETHGYHLNYQTVEKTPKFSLSISKDKYLIIPPMGTVTSTSIGLPSGEIKYYNIDHLTKIDLSGFAPGKYYINTMSCNAGGSNIMILKK